jgi:hypothetical protein
MKCLAQSSCWSAYIEHGVTSPDAPLPVSKAVATQPLNRYPLYPHYMGHGDAGRAENWRCTTR